MSKLTDAQRKALVKRAHKHRVQVWDAEGKGWVLPDGSLLDAELPTLPDKRLTLTYGVESLIKVAVSNDPMYDDSTWTGVGCSDGYVCATDRYRAHSLTVEGAPDVHLSPAMCRTLAPLLSSQWWGTTVVQAWHADSGGLYVHGGMVLLYDPNASVDDARSTVSTVRKVMPQHTTDRQVTEVTYPAFPDAYEAALIKGAWVAMPDPRDYQEVRSAYLREHTPTVLLNAQWARDAFDFCHGALTLDSRTPGLRATYASCTVGGEYREVLLMPIRLS